jgi:hypothetical protein
VRRILGRIRSKKEDRRHYEKTLPVSRLRCPSVSFIIQHTKEKENFNTEDKYIAPISSTLCSIFSTHVSGANISHGSISFEVMGDPQALPRQRFDSRKAGHFYNPAANETISARGSVCIARTYSSHTFSSGDYG